MIFYEIQFNGSNDTLFTDQLGNFMDTVHNIGIQWHCIHISHSVDMLFCLYLGILSWRSFVCERELVSSFFCVTFYPFFDFVWNQAKIFIYFSIQNGKKWNKSSLHWNSNIKLKIQKIVGGWKMDGSIWLKNERSILFSSNNKNRFGFSICNTT